MNEETMKKLVHLPIEMANGNGENPPSTTTKMETINRGANDHHCGVQHIHIDEHAAKTCSTFGTYLIAIGETLSNWLETGL